MAARMTAAAISASTRNWLPCEPTVTALAAAGTPAVAAAPPATGWPVKGSTAPPPAPVPPPPVVVVSVPPGPPVVVVVPLLVPPLGPPGPAFEEPGVQLAGAPSLSQSSG